MLSNIARMVNWFNRLASKHTVKTITEVDRIGFPYDELFKAQVVEKYNHPIIKRLLENGILDIGIIIKLLEGESELFDAWFEQYSKVYSPLGYFRDFEEPYEEEIKAKSKYLVEELKSRSC
jgi:hypothetical protein